MSKVKLFRIDERLIHGQVVTAWLGHTRSDEIIVIDDKIAGDSLMCSIYAMAVPPNVSLRIISIKEAEEQLNDDNLADRIMVIVRTPATARTVLAMLQSKVIPQINMGNAGMAAGRSKLTSNVYLDQAGINDLCQIAEMGYEVFFQAIPGDRRFEWSEVISNKGEK